VFYKPPALLPGHSYRGFVRGWHVSVSPPICGESTAIIAMPLEVELNPWATARATSR
jgi:hypothetical protein